MNGWDKLIIKFLIWESKFILLNNLCYWGSFCRSVIHPTHSRIGGGCCCHPSSSPPAGTYLGHGMHSGWEVVCLVACAWACDVTCHYLLSSFSNWREEANHPSTSSQPTNQPTNHSWWMRRDDRLVGSNWMLSGNDFNISWSRPFSWPILLAFRLSNPHTAQTNIMTSKRMMMGGRLTTYKAGQGEISSTSNQSMYSWTYKLCRVQSAIIKGLPSLWIINIKGLRTENPSKADLKAPSFCCHATGTAAAASTSSAAAAEPFPAFPPPPAKKIKTSYLHPLWMSDLTFRESAEVEHDHHGLIARNTSKFEGGGENFRLQVGVSSLLLLLLSNKVRILLLLLLCSREIVTISMDELYGV